MYTPGPLCRCPPRPGIPAVCVSQKDGQFLFLAIFSRRWNIDKLPSKGFWLEIRGWEWSYHRVADNITLSDPFELGWIEPLIRTVQNDFRLLTLLRPELMMNVNEYGVCKG